MREIMLAIQAKVSWIDVEEGDDNPPEIHEIRLGEGGYIYGRMKANLEVLKDHEPRTKATDSELDGILADLKPFMEQQIQAIRTAVHEAVNAPKEQG